MLVVGGFNYVGGVAMAKSIVQQDQAPDSPTPDTSPWCICSRCRPMEHAIENICCCRYNCITSTTFRVVLDRNVLSVAIVSRSDLFADDPDYNPASSCGTMVTPAGTINKLFLHVWFGELEMNTQHQMELFRL